MKGRTKTTNLKTCNGNIWPILNRGNEMDHRWHTTTRSISVIWQPMLRTEIEAHHSVPNDSEEWISDLHRLQQLRKRAAVIGIGMPRRWSGHNAINWCPCSTILDTLTAQIQLFIRTNESFKIITLSWHECFHMAQIERTVWKTSLLHISPMFWIYIFK